MSYLKAKNHISFPIGKVTKHLTLYKKYYIHKRALLTRQT